MTRSQIKPFPELPEGEKVYLGFPIGIWTEVNPMDPSDIKRYLQVDDGEELVVHPFPEWLVGESNVVSALGVIVGYNTADMNGEHAIVYMTRNGKNITISEE